MNLQNYKNTLKKKIYVNLENTKNMTKKQNENDP